MAESTSQQLASEKNRLFRRNKARGKVPWYTINFLIIIQFAVCMSITAIYLTILSPHQLQRVENYFLDLMIRFRPVAAVTSEVAYIEISEDSLQDIGRWPFSRQFHAVLVHALTQWKPRAIVFDVLFSEPSTYLEDGALQQALEDARQQGVDVYMPVVLERLQQKQIWIKPLEKFGQSVKSFGHIVIYPDVDGIIRRIRPFISNGDETFMHLAIRVAMDRIGREKISKDDFLRDYGNILDQNGNLLINWVGSWDGTFKHYSFVDILRSYDAISNGEAPLIKPSEIENKVLYVGLTAMGHSDLKPTPLTTLYPTLGLYGNVLNSFLLNQYLRPVNDGIYNLLVFIFAVVAVFFFVPFRYPASFISATLLIVAWIGGSLFAVNKGIWVYVFHPTSLIFGMFFFSAIYAYAFISREKGILFKLATQDALTGFYNMRHFRELINRAAQQEKSRRQGLALLLMDIDYFKMVNDRFGHSVGDMAITFVAQKINDALRVQELKLQPENYFCGRYGGDEFMVCIKGVQDIQLLRCIGEALCRSIESEVFQAKEDQKIQLTCSVGIGVLHQNETFPDLMVLRADKALYRSKYKGRNCVSLETEVPEDKASAGLE